MSNASMVRDSIRSEISAGATRLTWLGVLAILVGAAAIVFPMVSTMTIVYFTGILLLVFGAISLGVSFSIIGAGPFFASLLFSLLSIGSGIYLLARPQEGAQALTLFVGFLFLMQGAYEMAFAFEMRPLRGWWAMLLSSLASVVLAIVILTSWPAISMIVLGTLFGVNFLSSGIALVMVAQALKT